MENRNFGNKNLRDVSRNLRNNMTEAEKKLWYQFLKNLKPRAHRQRPIGNYIVDFYIPKANLVIEIDGDSHFIDGLAQNRDVMRDKLLNSMNLHVMRFTNNDVFNSFDFVCSRIEEYPQTPPSPLS